VRFRDMDRIDMDAARQRVAAWMTGYPGGTPDQMAADLKGEYGQFAEDMVIVLRGFMARFQDHPEELASSRATGKAAAEQQRPDQAARDAADVPAAAAPSPPRGEPR
jgi:hypothetical protein